MTKFAYELLINALDQRWEKYLAQLKSCQNTFSEEAVHDLRVATRRILALIEVLRGISPHPRLQKLRRAFKNQLDGLDNLRDTQVMLIEISRTMEELPELHRFQKHLQKREKRLLRTAAKLIAGIKTGSMARRINKTRQTLQTEPPNAQAQIFRVLDDTYSTVMQRFEQIDPTHPSSIHFTRVAFKKLRYLVEVIHPLIPDFPEKNLKIMHDYQTVMGNIQDVEVFLLSHTKFANKTRAYDPDPVRRFYEKRHTDLIRAFLDNMHEINTFWRAMPAQPFPWETQ